MIMNLYNLAYNIYFCRTYDGAAIDLIEENAGKLSAIEFKLNPKSSAKIPGSFSDKYKPVSFEIISPSNIMNLLKS